MRKISVLIICVEAIIHLLLYNLYDCAFNKLVKLLKLVLFSNKCFVPLDHLAFDKIFDFLIYIRHCLRSFS